MCGLNVCGGERTYKIHYLVPNLKVALVAVGDALDFLPLCTSVVKLRPKILPMTFKKGSSEITAECQLKQLYKVSQTKFKHPPLLNAIKQTHFFN